MIPRHLETGEWGEKIAEKYLKKKKLKILGRRVRVGDRDELDIVAREGDVLVFVEVKTRSKETYGRPLSAVNTKKKHVLSRAAIRYVKKLKKPGICIRFDVVEVVGAIGDKDPVIRHIENAFHLDKRYVFPF